MLNIQRTSFISHFIWLSLLVTSVFYLSSSLRVVSDITQFMPSHHKDKSVQLLLDELQKGNTARLLILRLKGIEAKNLAGLSQKIKHQLSSNPAFNLIHNGQNKLAPAEFISGEYKTLYKYRYLLSQPTSFSKESLHSSLENRLTEFRSGINIFKYTFSSDPQNHFINYLQNLTERANNTHFHGVWFDKEKKSALLLIELNLDDFNLDKQESAINDIYKTIDLLSNNKNLQIDITGTPIMAVKTRAAIQATSKTLSAIALVLMSFLFWWGYKSFRLFFIAMLPLLSAVIAALTMTNMVFQQVHGIIIAFGITLLGVCLDYPVHLFSHLTKSQKPQQTILSIWPTLRLGVITTSLAYLAMLGTGFSGLSQLSVFAITGLMTSLFVTRWIIPAWLQHDIKKPKHQYLIFLSNLNFSNNQKISAGLLVILFCTITLSVNFNSIWSKNISDLSPIPEAAKKLDQELRLSIGAPDVNHVFLLKDNDPEHLLQRTETLVTQLHPLIKENLVKNVFSITDFIPSQKTQHLYQQQLPVSEKIETNLHDALTNMPFNKGIFKKFISDIEQSKHLAPLNIEDALKSPLGKHLQQDLFFKNNQWHSIIRLTGVQNEALLLHWLDTQPDVKMNYLNLKTATSALMADYQETALFRLFLGAFVLGLILFLVRSRTRAIMILLPVILAVFLSISIQVALGTHLTLFHILALLLIVGIGLDYSLFFDRRWTSMEDYQHRLHGIFISASSTLITFGILGFSDITVLSALGKTVTFGVMGCFVLTLVFNINNRKKA